ncbi:peptidase U32 family protein [Neobacillus mesonae]|uniref:Peptidase U32 n=1 Tax=Neobacillus mesonae TaxID=1193713 RepID=A0A3Q9QWK8_9BACI|nr:U32 family peptidase [Neobacillus mesonae]AZU61958.1 peptidase U32 [Neobacillus mesonae]
MNILAPLGAYSEVEMLAENGANEFYCGITPTEWIDRYSPGVWLNRRNPYAGFPSFQELKKAVEASHSYGIPVFVTLNAPYYIDDQYPLLLDLVKYCSREIGVDAFIISDIGLMTAVKEQIPDAKIHVSSLAASMNEGSIELYKEIGVDRIVLPRSVQLDEITALKKAAGEIEIEVFLLNDGCVYEESFCMTTHNRVSAFCSQIQWDYQYFSANGNKQIKDLEKDKLDAQINDYREYVWFVNDCGGKVANDGLPLGPCGLCALPKLKEAGVDSLKIVGREGAAYRKIASVQMVKAVIAKMELTKNQSKVIEACKEIRNQPQFCKSGLMCYYR